ncbi:HPr family phosphocarrier protein [bacterium]|nr:HPr family phosphocarrier protein [bacterium]
MVKKIFKIKNKLGLHARSAASFVQLANKFESKIGVSREDRKEQQVNGKSIMGLMMLAAEFGSKILIVADGKDEQKTLELLGNLIDSKFGEE